jgi:Tfp pilus assembly protein PilN
LRPINLLPRELARDKVRRRHRGLIIFLALAYVGALAAGVVYWNSRVGSAAAEARAQEDSNLQLQQQVASLADAGLIKADFEAKAALVRSALVSDVDWGAFLNDLATLLPPRLWVETFSANVVLAPNPGVIGQISISGVGFDYPDVAAFLHALDSGAFVGVIGSWVGTAAVGVIGEEPVVNFSATAALTTDGVTGRADTLIPEVP